MRKWKIEKITSPYDLYISSTFPLLVSYTDFFLNCSPKQFFGNFIHPFKKRRWNWEGIENYEHSFENLHNEILLYLCVLVGAFWFFKIFLLLSTKFDMVFCKISELSFFWPSKTKYRKWVPSFPQVRITNPYGNFSIQINLKLKDSSVFLKSKFCGDLQLLVIHLKLHF